MDTVHVCTESVSQPEKCLTCFWIVLKCVYIAVHMPATSSTTIYESMFWTELNLGRLHSILCLCVCLPGLVHRLEPNPQQTRKEETVGGRHSDRHQSNWVRPACSTCQEQQQVDNRSLTDSLFLSLTNTQKTLASVLINSPSSSSKLLTSEIIKHSAHGNPPFKECL